MVSITQERPLSDDADHPGPRPSGELRPWRSDRGFTLIEVAVAMVVAAVLMVALTMTLAGSLRSVQQNQTVEQASALAIEQVEFVRSLTWDELMMDDDAHGDSRTMNPPPYGELIGAEVGLPANEVLVIDKHDGLVPFETFETVDDQDFVVRNYVTEVEPDLRRVVVVVDWVTGSAARSHQTSTLVAEKATE